MKGAILDYLLNTLVEHEFAADLGDLSFASLAGNGVWAGRDVVFPGGYKQIVDALAPGLDIRRGQPVTRINHTASRIVLTTVGRCDHRNRQGRGHRSARGPQARVDRIQSRTAVKEAARDQKAGHGCPKQDLPAFRRCLLERRSRVHRLHGRTYGSMGRDAQPIPIHPAADSHDVQRRRVRGADRAPCPNRKPLRRPWPLADMHGAVPEPKDAPITRWRSDPWACGLVFPCPGRRVFQPISRTWKTCGRQGVFCGRGDALPIPRHGAWRVSIRRSRGSRNRGTIPAATARGSSPLIESLLV